MQRVSCTQWVVIASTSLALFLAGCQPVTRPVPGEPSTEAAPADAETSTATADAQIANAMSAGPASLAANATIVDWPSASNPDFAELRAGSNGWTCLPDDPSTPPTIRIV